MRSLFETKYVFATRFAMCVHWAICNAVSTAPDQIVRSPDRHTHKVVIVLLPGFGFFPVRTFWFSICSLFKKALNCLCVRVGVVSLSETQRTALDASARSQSFDVIVAY
jgi:hypothetical protein